VLRSLYGQGTRFLRSNRQLRGGVFIILKHGQTLVVPPYNPHLTFAFGGSIMCGYEFEAIEFFSDLISYRDVEIEYIDNQYPDENDRQREHGLSLENWLDGLEHTLEKGDDRTKAKVVEAWIISMSTIKVAFQKTTGYEDRACAAWEKFLKNTIISQCPCCLSNSKPFEAHMMSQHVDIIRPQGPRARKRARHV
jgi:hypothetical protein